MSSSSNLGLPSYQGYEFQKLVTVWLGLKLMCDEQRCDDLIVEPASEEDVAANLKVLDATTTVIATAAEVPIEFQIKSRNKNWSASSFGEVVTTKTPALTKTGKPKGPPPRPRALEVLSSNPRQLFLLITNAQLDSDLAELKVASIGKKSGAVGMELGSGNQVPAAISARLGILADMTSERVELEIDQLLKKVGHVPTSQLSGCRAKLSEDVHRRLLGKASQRWPKTNLLEVMRAAGGMPSDQSAIVPPVNFPRLCHQLESRHCIILVGGAGIGKTETARELVRLHRLRDEPFERIDGVGVGSGGVSSALEAPGAHIFLFEDPWGSDRLSEDATFWAKELPVLMRRASPEKRFVVTSRAAIQQEASGSSVASGLSDYIARLEPAHYPEPLRLEIVARRISDAAPWQKDWIHRHQERWLRALTVPLSLDHFCSCVKRASSATELEIDDLVRECGIDVIAQTCTHEVRGRDPAGIAASVALWALLHARHKITQQSAVEATSLLRAGGYLQPIDLEKTFAWLIKAGWLRPELDGVSAHPTALTGIAQFLNDEPALADATLSALLIGLTNSGLAQEAFQILRHLAQRPGAVPGTVRAKIERFLVEDFLRATSGLARDAMSNIVTYSKAKDPVTLLVKALDARQPVSPQFPGFERWRKNTLSPGDHTAIRTSSEAYQAAKVFVLWALPDEAAMRYKGIELVAFFREFAWDFSLEFQALCHAGFADIRTSPNLDLLVECACLSEQPRFDDLLDRCFEGISEAEKLLEANAETRRAISDSEVNADASSHEEDEFQELLSIRYVILRDLVKFRRKKEGWGWIGTHTRRDELIEAWSEGLDELTSDDEVTGLIAVCGAIHRPAVWKGITKSRKIFFLPEILNDLLIAPLDEISGCAEQLVQFVPVDRWPELVECVCSLPLVRRSVLAAAEVCHDKTEMALRNALLEAFDPAERSAIELCQSADPDKPTSSFDIATRTVLERLAADATEELAAHAALVLAQSGRAVGGYLGRLRASKNRRARLWATLAGVVGAPPELSDSDLIMALEDRDYRICRVAMSALAGKPDPMIRLAILALHKHPSAPVREHCAELIGRHAWSDGVPILMALLRDQRDRNPTGYFVGSRPDLHVARSAATALRNFVPLDTESISSCLAFLQRPPVSGRLDLREDVEVHRDVLICLADSNDPRVARTLCELLGDDWYVVGNEHSGYPRRYAAAWGLFNHLHKHPESLHQLDLEEIVTGARHDDGRLAAPCLAILATIANSSAEPLIRACRSGATPLRVILAVAWLPDSAEDATRAARAILGNHASLELVNAKDLSGEPEDWEKWLAGHPQCAAWLKTIAAPDDVNPALRWTLSLKFSARVPREFASDDLQESLMPKSIKSLTTWSMFNE